MSLLLVAAGDVHERALLDQPLGGAESEASRPAGDERDAPLQCLRFYDLLARA
jgi:hypothetical protein